MKKSQLFHNREKALCSKCGNPGKFIRERPFEDGSGLVFMCSTPKCPSVGLYFYHGDVPACRQEATNE